MACSTSSLVTDLAWRIAMAAAPHEAISRLHLLGNMPDLWPETEARPRFAMYVTEQIDQR